MLEGKPEAVHIKLIYHTCCLSQVWPNCPRPLQTWISQAFGIIVCFGCCSSVLSLNTLPFECTESLTPQFFHLPSTTLPPLVINFLYSHCLLINLFFAINVVWWNLIYGKIENEINVHKNCKDIRWKMQQYCIAFPLKQNKSSCKHLKASHIFAPHPLFLCLTGC